MSTYQRSLYPVLGLVFFLSACQTVDLFERTANIPGHQWKSSFKPVFRFTILDTTVPYKVYLTLRHLDKYHFNNIYLKLTTRQPGADSTQSVVYDLPLGTDENGWMGSGMDDIFEHRIPLTPGAANFYFKRKGEYQFTIEQIMREDPLENVLNVGLRIEKNQP